MTDNRDAAPMAAGVLEAAVRTAILRFEYLAVNRNNSAIDPAVGAEELRAALASPSPAPQAPAGQGKPAICPHCGKPYIKCKCWGEVELQYREALQCLSDVLRAASHALIVMPNGEREAKLRAVLSKAHDWYMAEVNSHTYMGEPALATPAAAPKAATAPSDADLYEFQVRLSEYGVAMAHRQGEKARVLAEVLESMFESASRTEMAPHVPTCKCPKCEVDAYTAAAPELDAWECRECFGKGWNWGEAAVTHQLGTDMLPAQIACTACDGIGYCGPDAITAAKKGAAL